MNRCDLNSWDPAIDILLLDRSDDLPASDRSGRPLIMGVSSGGGGHRSPHFVWRKTSYLSRVLTELRNGIVRISKSMLGAQTRGILEREEILFSLRNAKFP